jgi:Transposase DDE domain
VKTKTKRRRLRQHSKSFVQCLRDFLTPALWKQAQKCRPMSKASRWSTQPLVLVLLFSTWCCGDSQPERFETAKAFCVVCLPKKRRPGQTVQGFQKALAKLPMAVLRVLAAGVRQTLARRLAARWSEAGFIPIGCDGSRVECPRAAELERHLGQAGKDHSAPALWITALVHLRLGVPWAWRLGKGTASERWHLEQLIPYLPAAALLVADAGYVGYALATQLLKANVSFLIRQSSNATLYTEQRVRLKCFREGLVYYWPQKVQKAGGQPLLLRLIRIAARKKKNDLWLLTNVRSAKRLSAATASRFYRWRWENEGQFRAYKRTLGKVKLMSRTIRLVHREAEGSLLALQLQLAQGVLAMPPRTKDGEQPVCSPRKVLVAIRQEMQGLLQRQHVRYYQRLQAAQRERRHRTSAKVKRIWPRRTPHKPPKPPHLLQLSQEQKALISQLKGDAV